MTDDPKDAAAEARRIDAADVRRIASEVVPLSVQPEWMRDLPLQQQSVLMLAARGPDGIAKDHPCKEIVRAYRGCVLLAAFYGRPLIWGEAADGFMSLSVIADDESWKKAVARYFETADELPFHYRMHLMHGAEILGYKAEWPMGDRWREFYFACCEDMHVTPETEAAMDKRLGDWGRKHWKLAALSVAPSRLVAGAICKECGETFQTATERDRHHVWKHTGYPGPREPAAQPEQAACAGFVSIEDEPQNPLAICARRECGRLLRDHSECTASRASAACPTCGK